MSEWWTYQLADLILFTPKTYFRLIEIYNISIWPIQLVALLLSCIIAVLVWRRPICSGKIIASILALSWLWVAWAFHLQRFADIHWVATYYAVGFVIQASLLIWIGVIRDRLTMNSVESLVQKLGISTLIFALFIQPLLTLFFGENRNQVELFGITPDPTVIATIGLLMLINVRKHWWIYIIPLSWCLISGATLWVLESNYYFVMFVVGILASLAIIKKAH